MPQSFKAKGKRKKAKVEDVLLLPFTFLLLP
jgi:hypothetical protein